MAIWAIILRFKIFHLQCVLVVYENEWRNEEKGVVVTFHVLLSTILGKDARFIRKNRKIIQHFNGSWKQRDEIFYRILVYDLKSWI